MKLTSIADLARTDNAILERAAQQLGRLFDEFYDNYPDDSHTREAGIHASELNTCKRQVIYTLFNVEKKGKIDKVWRKRFNVGTAIHNMLQRDFHLMEKFIKTAQQLVPGVTITRVSFDDEVRVNETELAKKYCLTSSCDGVFVFWHDGTPLIRIALEIKSKAPNDFEKMKRPEEKHIEQAHIYMACLDVPLTWFLYWNKGNQNITPTLPPYLVRFNPETWMKLEKRAQECLVHAEKTELPAREEGVHCRWCKYSWTCQPPSLQRQTKARPLLPILRK